MLKAVHDLGYVVGDTLASNVMIRSVCTLSQATHNIVREGHLQHLEGTIDLGLQDSTNEFCRAFFELKARSRTSLCFCSAKCHLKMFASLNARHADKMRV